MDFSFRRKGGEYRLKIFKFIAIFLVLIAVVYFGAIFLGFNLPKPAFMINSIKGSAVLEVNLLMDNTSRDPLGRVEVDVAEKPGPPPEGGVAITDESGKALFNIKPGNYFIYFNDLSFPKNIKAPEPKQVTVTEGKTVETILVTTKD